MTVRARGAGRRHRGRELALRVLFEIEGTLKDPEAALQYQAEDVGATDDVLGFARTLVYGCLEHLDAIDDTVSAASTNWRLEELGKVERAVLRMAAFELQQEGGTPMGVVIDEAVELAKTYAGEEAGSYVNGVLGRIADGG